MRLFFALWPPTEVAERLAAIARALAGPFGGKPTRQETIHLTLAFLGEVPEHRLPLLMHAAASVHAAAIALCIDRIGYWPHQHLLWAGESSPCTALGGLVDDLQKALGESGFAAAGGSRTFSPHVTLVRKLTGASAALTLPAIDRIDWPCSGFALVRSQSTGPAYEILCEFPLPSP